MKRAWNLASLSFSRHCSGGCFSFVVIPAPASQAVLSAAMSRVIIPEAASNAIIPAATSHTIVLAAASHICIPAETSHEVQIGLAVFVLDWSINKLSFPDVYQEPYHPLWWAEMSGKSPFSFTPSTSSSIHFSPLSKLQGWHFVVLQTCLAKRSGTNLLPDFTILLLGKCKVKCTIWHNNFWHRIISPTK